MIEENLVVIIKLVGFLVLRRTQPGNSQSLVSTYWRIERSIKRQIKREVSNTRPNTSIRWGLFQKNTVHDGRVLQKAEVLLDADLALVKGEQFPGRTSRLVGPKGSSTGQSNRLLP